MDAESQQAVERATQALDTVRDAWMQRPEVNAVGVGLLRAADGGLTEDVGILVTIDPTRRALAGDLPDRLDGADVQLLDGLPAPEQD